MRPSLLVALALLLPSARAFCRRWSSEGRYCLEERDALNTTVVRVRRGVFGLEEYEWPDEEMMRLMSSAKESFENVREIHFQDNCNWAFGWRYGAPFAMANLRLILFDSECSAWSDSAEHCVDLPSAWTRSQVTFANVFFCEDEQEVEESKESHGLDTVVLQDLVGIVDPLSSVGLKKVERHHQKLNSCNALLEHLSRQIDKLEGRLAACSKARSSDRVLIKNYNFVLSRLRHELTYIFSFSLHHVDPDLEDL
uniref:C-type lectin domain-containing protein n=1 Tax=Steinernema glaseri TaxID=37863 RepID=A0A1I7YAG8_9BILA